MGAFHKTSVRCSQRLLILIWLAVLACASARAAVVNATFSSATDIAVTASSYTATGNTINFQLNFAPVTGTTLTVVNNTGLPFISGAFDNLAQGQQVTLPFSGTNYKFVANYCGGTGNDLVLLWAGVRLMSWGDNSRGALGNGGISESRAPVSPIASGVLNGKTIVQMDAGGLHSLVVCSDGTLAAWGSNVKGQLGIGGTVDASVPTAVDRSGALAGKLVVAVSAGQYHSIVLCADGTLAAWGYNASGQLGNNSTLDSSVPVGVMISGTALEGKQVIGVSAGSTFSLALCSDGTVVAWGSNSAGQLGNNSTTDSLVAVAVTTSLTALAGKRVVRVAAGSSHGVALCSDGTVATWGANSSGQLGIGTTTQSLVPVPLFTTGTPLNGKFVVSVATKDAHTLALASDGTVVIWGSNNAKQVSSTGGSIQSLPVAVNRTGVLSTRTVVAIGAGYSHSQAICSDGRVVSWGRDGSGEYGSNATQSSSSPQLMSITSTAIAGKTPVAVVGGNNHSLILCSDGTLAATGSNAYGQLGSANAIHGRIPSDVTNTGVLAGKTVIAASCGNYFTVAACSDGTLVSWGAGNLGNGTSNSSLLPVASTASGVLLGKKSIAIAAGGGFVLALCSDGTLASWGNNSDGALGIGSGGSSNFSDVPVLVSKSGPLAGKTVVAISAGQFHSVALCSDGTVATWGYNFAGQLGNNTTTTSYLPVAVSTTGALAGKTVTAIASGTNHTLALCSDGTLVSWGDNSQGQLGNNSNVKSLVPIAVDRSGALAGKTVVAIAAGNNRSQALCADGSLAAWGAPTTGNLTFGTSKVPVDASSINMLATKQITKIAANAEKNLAVIAEGTIAWSGFDIEGTSTFGVNSLEPVLVNMDRLSPGERFVSVFAGSSASQVLGLAAFPVLPSVTTLPAAAVSSNGATLNGRANADGNSTTVSFEYGLTTSYGNSIAAVPATINGISATNTSGTLSALTPGTTYHFRAVATNTTGTSYGDDIAFTTVTANDTTLASLTLSTGTLVPGFSPAISSYTASVPAKTSSLTVTPVASDSNATVELQLNSGSFNIINPGATSAALAINPFGSDVVNIKVTARDGISTQVHTLILEATPQIPTPTTLSASGIGLHGATLNGSVVANSVVANASFEYGLTTAYGNSIAAAPSSSSGAASTLVSASVSNLVSGTTYHFRAIATNNYGTATSPDFTFTTLPSTDATLSNLTASIGDLSPAFDSLTTTYNVASSSATTSLTIVATANDSFSSLAVRTDGGAFAPILSGTESNALTIHSTGVAVVQVRVTAQDGVTSRTYTLNVYAPLLPSTATTVAASAIGTTSATLNGLLNPDGNSTAVFFDFGETTAYGQSIAGLPSPVAALSSTAVSASVSGLKSKTTYHFRVGGTNSGGTTTGGDLFFTTLPKSDALLANLAVSTGIVTKPIVPGVTSYSISVPLAATALSFTPTLSDPNATIGAVMDGEQITPVSSGLASPFVPLNSSGTTVVTLIITAQDNATTKTYTLTVTHRSAYTIWQQTHFGAAIAQIGYTDDFDGDGLNNLTEFAFGTLPTDNKSGGSPLSYVGNVISPGSAITEVIANKPTAEYIRRSDYLTSGLTYTVQFSAKLNAWETDTRTPTVLATDGINQVVGLTFPKLSTGVQAKFFRVTVSVAP